MLELKSEYVFNAYLNLLNFLYFKIIISAPFPYLCVSQNVCFSNMENRQILPIYTSGELPS